jgi:erythronate-4-phosphate dehydrogenase
MLLIDDQIPLLQEIFSSVASVRAFDGRALTKDDLLRYRATALFVRSTTRVDRSLLEGTRVTFVASATSGTDHIDRDALDELGITVVDAIGSNANAVAEYVVAAALYDGRAIDGCTVGVVGYGNVGPLVAQYFDRLGANVIVHDPLRAAYDQAMHERHVDQDTLLSTADIITFHPNLHVEEPYPSLHMLHADNVGLIRDDALVINTSRGDVFTSGAIDALLRRTNGRLVLDTWPLEPTPTPSVVRDCLLATPHVAGYTLNAKEQGAVMVATSYILACGYDIGMLDRAAALEDDDEIDVPWDADALRELLLVRRPLDVDSDAFKAAYLADPSASAFDAARKQYPLRFETLHI